MAILQNWSNIFLSGVPIQRVVSGIEGGKAKLLEGYDQRKSYLVWRIAEIAGFYNWNLSVGSSELWWVHFLANFWVIIGVGQEEQSQYFTVWRREFIWRIKHLRTTFFTNYFGRDLETTQFHIYNSIWCGAGWGE